MTPEVILYSTSYLGLARPQYTIEELTPTEVYEISKTKSERGHVHTDIVQGSTEFHNYLIGVLNEHPAVQSQDDSFSPHELYKKACNGPFYRDLTKKIYKLRRRFNYHREANLRSRLRFAPQTLTPEEREEAMQSMHTLFEKGKYGNNPSNVQQILEMNGKPVVTRQRPSICSTPRKSASQHSKNVPPANPPIVIDLSSETGSEDELEVISINQVHASENAIKTTVVGQGGANIRDDIITTSKALTNPKAKVNSDGLIDFFKGTRAVTTSSITETTLTDRESQLEMELFGSIDTADDIRTASAKLDVEGYTIPVPDIEMELDDDSIPMTKSTRKNPVDLEFKNQKRTPLLFPGPLRTPGLSVSMSGLEVAESPKKKDGKA